MATFQYSAIKMSDKAKIRGTINAETEREARELLREQELLPTSVKPLKLTSTEDRQQENQEQSWIVRWINDKLTKIGEQEKISFTQNLEMMVRAGIPITESLLYMETYMENEKFRRMLNTIRLDILSGYSFSRALDKHNKVFTDIYISIIRAGEASGELESVLHRLGGMLIGDAKLKKKVIGALIYPLIVVFIATIVVLIMFIFVLPTFADMYNKMGIELPLITKIMIGISSFLRNFWFIAIGMGVGLYFGGKKYVASPSGKRNLDIVLLKIPVASPLILAVASSHFISTLNISFSAGLPITDCIFMACQTITHTTIRQSFDEVNLRIQAGQRLAAALADTSILPPMVLIMISTGEESGSLEKMLGHALEYLEEEVNQRVEILMTMMEPLMLMVLGVIVGCMAMAIYMPLFGMYEHLH